jgi:rSAM/selenodomain-associated transferase 1
VAAPRPTLVIFLRAPQRGAVKRRLARSIGDRAAHDFYARESAALVRRLGTDRRWRTVLAVTPDGFARRGRFWPAGLARIQQGGGDLGVRMARAFLTLPPGPIVLIGSDIPAIEAGHIARAFAALARFEAVFGPAIDGGYWLVGLARRRGRGGALARKLFAGVRWSGPHALDDTRANLPAGVSVARLDVLEDVDDAATFARWREQKIPDDAQGSVLLLP